MENNFSYSKLVKLSIQSLDTEVLKNIDRKNIELDTQLTALQPLAKKNKYPIFIEMILGLPGMTLEKFYHELDVLGGYNLSAMWYEWLLLPETPAYDPKYMQQHCIKTVQRNNGWAHYEPSSKMNIVIETKSYSKENYLEMLLAVSIYHAIIQGGLYSGSINWIVKTHSIGLGQIIQEIYNRYYQDQFSKTWHDILDDPEKNCLFTIKEHQVFVGLYFGALAFLDPLFADSLKRLLIEKYNCPSKLLNKEQKKLININNSNKTFNEIINDFILSKSNILKRKTLFGRFYW